MEALLRVPRIAIAGRWLDCNGARSAVGVVYYALLNDNRSHWELCEMLA